MPSCFCQYKCFEMFVFQRKCECLMCGLVFVMPHRVSVNVSMSHVEAKLAFRLFSHSVHVLSVKKFTVILRICAIWMLCLNMYIFFGGELGFVFVHYVSSIVNTDMPSLPFLTLPYLSQHYSLLLLVDDLIACAHLLCISNNYSLPLLIFA